MNHHLLRDNVQEFIHTFPVKEIHSLILKGCSFEGVSVQELAIQIESFNRVKHKIPLFSEKGFIYPNKLNLEQSSSQLTAIYKQRLFSQLHSFLDCTGGFGVDSFFMSKNAIKSIYCELNTNLSEIVKHNFKQLDANIEVINIDGIEFLKKTENHFDCIYIDPSRRSQKGKVISLEQSQPNILEYWNLLLAKSNQVIVKLSPMLDLYYLVRELPFVNEIHVVSVKNDVKEILLIASNQRKAEQIELFSVELSTEKTEIYSSRMKDDFSTIDILSNQQTFSFLYEPLGCLLKANLQDQYAKENGLIKFAPKSNFFLSDELLELPLMKRFRIKQQLPFKRKEIVSVLPSKQVNVVTRNFPLKPEAILKKLKLKQGGDDFLLCTSSVDKKYVCILANRV